ncbi:MAG: hypothetical protein ABJB16_03080, partial [Saprospiraceae bacterium]
APPFRSGQKHVVPGTPGIWAMYASNGDQVLSRPAISSGDRTNWRAVQGYLGYSKGDFNMNVVAGSEDETIWKINQNTSTGIIFY